MNHPSLSSLLSSNKNRNTRVRSESALIVGLNFSGTRAESKRRVKSRGDRVPLERSRQVSTVTPLHTVSNRAPKMSLYQHKWLGNGARIDLVGICCCTRLQVFVSCNEIWINGSQEVCNSPFEHKDNRCMITPCLAYFTQDSHHQTPIKTSTSRSEVDTAVVAPMGFRYLNRIFNSQQKKPHNFNFYKIHQMLWQKEAVFISLKTFHGFIRPVLKSSHS